jgi:dTDP-4-dehydrorhamnose reductase
MRVLITGAGGQLGGALLHTAPSHLDLNAIGADDVDFTDLGMLRARLVVEAPDLIINAAAYTDFGAAEREEGLAREVNADAVAVLVEAMEDTGDKLIHISCDCVFDGAAARLYLPDDAANPLSACGRSKAEGEAHLRPQDLLIRTSWLYEAGGNNFVRAMLKQMQERGEVVAISDQISSPTWATGLARTIWALAAGKASGIFHHCDAGVASHYDVALALAEEALALGLVERMPTIKPITNAEAEEPARRPAFSALNCGTTRAFLGDEAVDWRANLLLMLKAEKNHG